MQCSLKLELFFIAMGNSGFEWIEQILEIFVEPLSQMLDMAYQLIWILKSCKDDNISNDYVFLIHDEISKFSRLSVLQAIVGKLNISSIDEQAAYLADVLL